MHERLLSSEATRAKDVYYEEGFRNVIEDHLQLLIKDSETASIPVSPMQIHKCEFDLTKLFRELKIPPDLHWIVMRMNGINSTRDYPEDKLILLVPSVTRVSRLVGSYLAVGKI